MMIGATLKSQTQAGPLMGPVWRVVGVLHLVAAVSGLAEEIKSKAEMAYVAYQQAKAEHQTAATTIASAWQFGRACFDWAEFSTNDTQRALLAQEGIEACEKALALEPDSAAAHYYLGMNQGQLARTMNLGALRIVNEMEAHFETARKLDPEFDYAGPDRNLGLLYFEAPGWPLSVGNRSKASAHLHKAVDLAPHYPENRLNLMEACQRWNQNIQLRRQMKDWERNLEAAHDQFSGDRWHWAWIDWEERLKILKEHLAGEAPDLRSPKARG